VAGVLNTLDSLTCKLVDLLAAVGSLVMSGVGFIIGLPALLFGVPPEKLWNTALSIARPAGVTPAWRGPSLLAQRAARSSLLVETMRSRSPKSSASLAENHLSRSIASLMSSPGRWVAAA
jgi:hypothetical protein